MLTNALQVAGLYLDAKKTRPSAMKVNRVRFVWWTKDCIEWPALLSLPPVNAIKSSIQNQTEIAMLMRVLRNL